MKLSRYHQRCKWALSCRTHFPYPFRHNPELLEILQGHARIHEIGHHSALNSMGARLDLSSERAKQDAYHFKMRLAWRRYSQDPFKYGNPARLKNPFKLAQVRAPH